MSDTRDVESENVETFEGVIEVVSEDNKNGIDGEGIQTDPDDANMGNSVEDVYTTDPNGVSREHHKERDRSQSPKGILSHVISNHLLGEGCTLGSFGNEKESLSLMVSGNESPFVFQAEDDQATLMPNTTHAQLLVRVLDTRKHLDLTNRVVVDYTTPNLRLGGSADVYQGRLIDSDQKVAVKCIRMHYDNDGKNAKYLASEIRIWSELVHPNIMPLRGFCIDRGYPNLVSEWMEKGSLREHMKCLNKIETVKMALGIARGLAYIHSRSAVHSDVKSDNVLISPDQRPLLTDFGISRMDNISAGYTTHMTRGTTRWQAIEFFQITEDSSPKHTDKTDVWAFGMTVYELLTHKMPFYHINNDTFVMFHILRGNKPKDPMFSNDPSDAEIERFLWTICLKCWEKNPDSRPSMSELEEDIEAFALTCL